MRSLKNLPLWSILLPLFSTLPLGFLLFSTRGILADHIRTIVVNEPEKGLQQMAAGFQGCLDSIGGRLGETASRIAEGTALVQAMGSPSKNRSKILGIGKEKQKDLDLLLIVDKKGNILFDDLGIPAPTPAPTPSPVPTSTPVPVKKKAKKKKDPSPKTTPEIPLPSTKDAFGWGEGSPASPFLGLTSYSDHLYLVASRSIPSGEGSLGAVYCGTRLEGEVLSSLEKGAGGNLAILSQGQTLLSDPSFPIPLQASLVPSGGPVTLPGQGQTVLALTLSLPSFDPNLPSMAILFHPIRTSQVLEGSPLEALSRTGYWLLLWVGSLATILGALSFFTFKGLLRGLDKVQEGGAVPSLPDWIPGEWGRLGESLKSLSASQREKDRISLVLGKVVSPLAAKKVLEANELFAMKGEQKECSLLLVELKGFPSLSENMSPPVLVGALNQYFDLINEAVFKWEGMLDRFMGEKALAVWGVPSSHEDKEARAVQAALEIQENLKAFNIQRIKKGAPPFTLGIGIHTGFVVAGNLGSEKHHDYTIIGEALQVVGRLCSLAAPGQTVISEGAFQRIEGKVEVNPHHPVALRDRSEPMKTFEIIRWL